MASTTILSDNGASSGSAGIKTTGGNDGVLILQTTTSGGTATNAVYINNTQKVGVGTASPSTNLTIGNGGGGSDLGVALSRGATTNFFEAYDGAKTMIVGTDASNAYVKLGSLSSSPVAIIQGNTNAIYIDTSGRVTMPTQPSFLACSNSGDTTVTAGTAIPLNVAAYNVGSCYNTSTYRFTAPVAGKYLFTSVAYYTSSGGNTQSMQCAPFINGSQYIPSGGGDAVLFSGVTPNTTGVTAIGSSVILNLAANDYVTMAARGTNGRFYLGHSSFSGQLIS